MASEIGFALVGCGRVARKHVDAIAQTPGARLLAVCDREPARAEPLARSLGVGHFYDAEDMISRTPGVDVVCVLTPTGWHAETVLEVAALGKHVVVEKPMALTLADADAMIAACERAGVHLFVVKQNRYNAPIQRVRRALDAGRFGKLVMGTARIRWTRRQDYYDQDDWRGSFRLDGGVLANQGSHYIDLLSWMLGPIEAVTAMTATRLVDIETEDTAGALLRFASGALGIVEATTATRPVDLEGSLSVLGERGAVVVGGFAVNEITAWRFDSPAPEDSTVMLESRTIPDSVHGFGHRALIANVVAALRREPHALVDGREGRKSVEILNAIYESAVEHREVALPYRGARSPLGRSGSES